MVNNVHSFGHLMNWKHLLLLLSINSIEIDHYFSVNVKTWPSIITKKSFVSNLQWFDVIVRWNWLKIVVNFLLWSNAVCIVEWFRDSYLSIHLIGVVHLYCTNADIIFYSTSSFHIFSLTLTHSSIVLYLLFGALK
jgi:hypothetical protein